MYASFSKTAKNMGHAQRLTAADRARCEFWYNSDMSEKAKKLLAEALLLPDQERAGLVDELCVSLPDFDEGELGPEWEAEIKRRIEDLKTGRVKPLTREEVMNFTTEKNERASA